MSKIFKICILSLIFIVSIECAKRKTSSQEPNFDYIDDSEIRMLNERFDLCSELANKQKFLSSVEIAMFKKCQSMQNKKK